MGVNIGWCMEFDIEFDMDFDLGCDMGYELCQASFLTPLVSIQKTVQIQRIQR